MSFSIVVPKKKITKGKRKGFGSDFWKSFWEKEITNDNREHYSQSFSRRMKQIDTTVKTIKVEARDSNQLLYAEIKLDDHANSKSNSPSEVWSETGLEIVGAKDERTLIVSGKKEDFERLADIGSSGSFESALTGEDFERKKDKNLLREVYAMSSVTPRNSVIEGRISSYIYSFINISPDREIDCIIEIYSNVGLDKYDSLFGILNENPIFKGKIKRRKKELFFTNASFLSTMKVREVLEILSNPGYGFINKIKEQPSLSSQRCIPDINLNSIQLLPTLTNETIGLIDSGVYNSSLINLRSGHYNHLSSNQKIDEHHGTTVASRILFGDDFFEKLSTGTSIAPTCKILDIQVLYLKDAESKCIELDNLKSAISEVVKRHEDVSIYNLSISDKKPVDKDDISELTEFLDNIARLYDVIFVCAIGNHQVFATQHYGEIFKQEESIMSSPSDALNIISVGSTSSKVHGDFINTQQNFPAPFTRTSGVYKNMKKPELVANGGNIKKDPTSVYGDSHMIASSKLCGVDSISKDGLYKDIGTSLSTPIITRECAILLDFIRKSKVSEHVDIKNNKFNLIKTLLIHSTAKVNQAKIEDDYIKRAYGFGIPDHKSVLSHEANELTLLYADKVNLIDRKHTLQIQLPQSILGKKVEFIFTLVYNPPVDKNYPQTYKMMSIEPTVRFLVPDYDQDGNLKSKSKALRLNPTASWDNYFNPNHNVIHFRKIRNKVSSSVLEVLLQLSATQPYESKILGRESSENQPYAFMLTIRDLSDSKNFREETMLLNEFQELVQNEVQEEVRL